MKAALAILTLSILLYFANPAYAIGGLKPRIDLTPNPPVVTVIHHYSFQIVEF